MRTLLKLGKILLLALPIAACNSVSDANPVLTSSPSYSNLPNCPPVKTYRITGVKVTAGAAHSITYTGDPKYKSPSRSNEHVFTVKTLSQVVPQQLGWSLMDFLLPSAMASSCSPGKVINPTVLGKSQFVLNRPIQFKGRNLPAGTNLMRYQAFDGSFHNISMPLLSPFGTGEIRIMKDFTLPRGSYQARFTWVTQQGQTFSDQANFTVN